MSARTSRHRYFSLLEVLIALSLTTLLLASLLFVYRQSAKAQYALDQPLWEARRRLALDERLQELFFSVAAAEESGFWFYTVPGPALVFSYHNGIDPHPHFSSLVLGQLYVDDHQRLILATWPHPDLHGIETTPRLEVLAAGVDELSLLFYEPPSLTDPTPPPQDALPITAGLTKVPVPSDWETTRWQAAYQESPALITLGLTFTQGKKTLSLRYALRGPKRSPHTWYFGKD